VIVADAAAMRALGARLAAQLTGGEAIALVGDLGAGKTTLVAGLVDALGGGIAASPTFSLVNEYRGGRLIVWHADLYRLDRAAELVELGLDDVIDDARGVVVVEWADKFAVMPPDHLRIELAHVAAGRQVTWAGTGPRSGRIARSL
jgi:tRNA threonylcarbamoyladenosine biosynthesis protein TsaE